MTSTTLTNLDRSQTARPLISPAGWVWLIALGLLFALFHYVFLRRTMLFALNDNNWSHAMIVPLISGYFIYQHRQRLQAIPAKVCWWGLPILFVGLAGYAMGIYPVRNDMAQGYAMIVGLFGLVLFLLGTGMMRVLWFPILYLVFAVKVSDRIWEQVAFQLQQIAAVGATFALQFFTPFIDGFHIDYRGSTIELTYRGETNPLNVAEACSGLRMLMAFLALGTAMAFLFDRPWWQRIVMVSMAVPIAVLVNIGRVTAIGLLYLIDPGYAQGDFHTFVGMLMLIPAALLFLLLGWIMDKIVIQDESPADETAATTSPAAKAPAPHAMSATAEGDLGLFRRHAGLIGRFVGLGILLAGGAVTIYIGGLMGIRPDLIAEGLSPWVGYVVGGAALIGVVVLSLFLPRWMPGQDNRAGLLRFTAAAALVAGVLAASLVGQQTVLAMTQAVLFKEAVPLRHRLIHVPDHLGPWQLVREDPPLSREMIEELGTDTYLSRWYQDTSWNDDQPGGIIRLHVAYYTGTVDTVPHVPERCFVAGGLEHRGRGLTMLDLPGDRFEADPVHGGYLHPASIEPMVRIPERNFRATYFTFAAPNRQDQQENVIYFFVANGKYLATPDEVRIEGFNPRDRYSYYFKVELQMHQVGDRELASERAAAFLEHAMPELMACLPDWVDVTEGRYPVDDRRSSTTAAQDQPASALP
ncbi:exosortase/archaeosortase family protein [Phycisphaerales bacterium AB-hyl4]|uniref:Exosortase/archaeosortase family protein n=1 Tax=Natronomicrosphaera hydrolytica TaxID=3242702 RepID=A0ABV4TZJ2_9BACT